MIKWFKSDKNIWTLLKRNISKGQMTGYILSNIIGLSVVLIGLMFYLDSNHSTEKEDSFFSQDFMVLSKRVDGIGFEPVSFSEEEIEELKSQPWVKKIGQFTSSQFSVKASIDMGGHGLSSYLFCESVPDDFFDVRPRDWDFDPQEGFVPIMLSKDYLMLYNFGFAIPQGLPQVSENVIGAVPIRLTLSGPDHFSETYDAAIVGFSSRLNTIAVPQSFMDWANQRYGGEDIGGEESNPSRLIVEIDRLSSSDAHKYLEEHEIEIAGDKANDGNISRFLRASSLMVTLNGVLISSLAVFILVLSIFLLLQKSKEKLRYLMLLGYSPAEIGSYYERIVAVVNLIVAIVALIITLSLRHLWTGQLKEIGLGDASVFPLISATIVYFILITGLNVLIIRRTLKKDWQN
ncbi:MAG: ABC transporter permease [Muribaculaceae bacterium]|nr:ABC transporter permease [Muribaculaceae bacterium]